MSDPMISTMEIQNNLLTDTMDKFDDQIDRGHNVEVGNVKLKRGDVAPSRCQTIKLLSPLWGLMQSLGSTKDAFTIEAVLSVGWKIQISSTLSFWPSVDVGRGD